MEDKPQKRSGLVEIQILEGKTLENAFEFCADGTVRVVN
jgi:hypothetical protein